MMIPIRASLFASIVTITILMQGCAVKGRPIDELVIEVFKTSSEQTDKVLSVLPVKGGEKEEKSLWKPMATRVDNEEFFQLLLGTLQKSRLFREVTPEQRGDYSLRTEIIFQENIHGLTSTVILLVHYVLIDRNNGHILWKENIFTQQEMSSQEILIGEERVARLFEKSLVANMGSLIDSLENQLIE